MNMKKFNLIKVQMISNMITLSCHIGLVDSLQMLYADWRREMADPRKSQRP